MMLFDPFQKKKSRQGYYPPPQVQTFFLCVKRWDCCGGEAEWISFTLDPCRWMNRKGRQTHPMPNETFRKKQTSSARRERNTFFLLPKKPLFENLSSRNMLSKKVVSLQNCDKKVLRQCRGNETISEISWVFDVTCKKRPF